MDNVKLCLQGVELDRRTAALLTGAACGAGALVVAVLLKVQTHREAQEKIRRARGRRADSLQRAEQAVRRYKKSVRVESSRPVRRGKLL